MSKFLIVFLVLGLAGLFFYVSRKILPARKKKAIPDELKKAFEQGLITEEEMLRLRCERAEEVLKAHLLSKKKK